MAQTRAKEFDPQTESTKIARFSAAAAAIFTAPGKIARLFEAPRCAISSAKKIASERRISLRLKGRNLIPIAEFPAIPESVAKIASQRRCAILVHSAPKFPHARKCLFSQGQVSAEGILHLVNPNLGSNSGM